MILVVRPPLLFPVSSPEFCVMAVMAFLAKTSQVQKTCGLGCHIENMGCGEDHFASGDRMGLIVFGPTPFTFIFRSIESNKT